MRAAAGLPEAELAAVCDTDAKTRDRLAPQYPAVYFTAEAADLLGRVDAAIIAAPAAIHARLALQCIEAGKPCLIEKPVLNNDRPAGQGYFSGPPRGFQN